MLALLASVLIVAFVIVPGVVFRTFFSFFVPLKAFDRTRTEEFAYAVVVCVVPLTTALVLVHHTGFGRWPFSFPDTWALGDADYRTVLLTCFSERFASTGDEFWDAAIRSSRRCGRLWLWYSCFVAIEAMLLGFVASKWGAIQLKLRKVAWLDQQLTSRLLRNISEWHVLLTSFLFSGSTIHVDILTTDDHLYRGDVLDHTRDRDGDLTGIYLDNAERYDRRGLLADRDATQAKPPGEYWKAIPGKRFFIFADKISTLNIRTKTTEVGANRVAQQELDPSATVTVKPVEEPGPQGASPPAPGAPELSQ